MKNSFGINIIPDNDKKRIEALRRYRILDTPPESAFDNVARLATLIFGVPIALVSLVDADEVYFKANVGMGKARVSARGVSLCSLAVLKQEVTVFEDAPSEPCLLTNPNVAGEFGLKFYAGAPLTTHDGFRIGTLCVIDKTQRTFGANDQLILEGLAQVVMDEIELRLSSIVASEEQQVIRGEYLALNEELTATNEELASAQENLKDLLNASRESEVRFRTMAEGSGILIAVSDETNTATYFSKAWVELLGRSMDDLLQSGWLDLVHPEDRDRYVSSSLDAWEERIPFTGEFRILTEEGIYRWLLANGQPRFHADGAFAGYISSCTDITDQIDNRNAMKEVLLRFNIALDAGKLGSTEVELATGKMICTSQFKKCYGRLENEDFTYPDLFESMLPEYRDEVRKRVTFAQENRSIYEAEYEVRWPDGSLHWLSAYGQARYDEQGNATRMVDVVSEITERKKYEQRRDDFLSVVSHELKTPLTSLKANLQLLDRIKNDPENPVLPRLIESSTRSMTKINGLVDDLLNMRRYGETQLRLDKTTFTVAEMLSLCCNHVRVAGKHELIIEGDQELKIYADEHRIDQVVVNLVNNAVKYAPNSKEIIMTVSRDEHFARISIRDFGPGIPAEHLPHLFDKYWQASYSTEKYTGLGLGLAICADIIKRHDGEIGVDSVVGEGSTFWFTIPLV